MFLIHPNASFSLRLMQRSPSTPIDCIHTSNQARLLFLEIVVELAAFSGLGDVAGADDEVAEALAVAQVAQAGEQPPEPPPNPNFFVALGRGDGGGPPGSWGPGGNLRI